MRTAGSKNQATDGRKVDIFFAAAGAFEKRGYEATTLDEICKRAKITKGSLYHHFTSKEDLAVQLYIDLVEEIDDEIFTELGKTKSAEDGIETLARSYLDAFDMTLRYGRFMFSVMYGRTLEGRAPEIKAAQQKLGKRVVAWLAPFAARGEIRELPPVFLMNIVLGPSRDFLREWFGTRDSHAMNAARDTLPAAAWRAIQSDPSHPRSTRGKPPHS